MKAVQVDNFGGPEVMRIANIPNLTPRPGSVVVRVRAIGVNPVDTYIRTGTYAVMPSLPYTPGMDAAGEIDAIGDGVTYVSVGDRVYTAGTLTGAYAEQTLCAEHQVFPLPDNVSFAQGAALGTPYGTAYRALFHRGEAKPGDTLLVHGASGAVGIAAVQMAKAAGIRVIGTAGGSAGLELVSREGAELVLNHHEESHWKKVTEWSDGKGVDIILEMLADVNLDGDLGILARFGKVVIVGSRGRIEINPRDLMGRDADVRGMTLMNLTKSERASIQAAIHAGLENETLRPIVSKEMPLEEAATAHHDVIEKSTLGKIVLVP